MQRPGHHTCSQGLLRAMSPEDGAVSQPLPEAQSPGLAPRLPAACGCAPASEQPHSAETEQRGIQLLLRPGLL